MNELQTTEPVRGVAIRALAIVGFFVTLALVVWLVVLGIRLAPQGFASLASIVDSLQRYQTVDAIAIVTEKTVVNSAESFQISWTDVKQDGEYHFTYACTEGVELEVRDGDGTLVPVACTETLSLPSTAHGLFISITSDEMRFTDVPLTVSFTNTAGDVALETDTKITVVNAAIPFKDATQKVVVKEEVKSATTQKPAEVPSTPKPQAPIVYTTVYPESNPNGYVDLAVKTLGIGVLKQGQLTFSATYNRDLENAIKFDIKNVGTKTSGTWTFKTILPNGEVYESKEQEPLKPQEHVEFTLGFHLGSTDDDTDLVKITNTAYTKNDTNGANNSSVWYVVVKD